MTHAITLSGGGAYGAFEIGVLKALMGGYAPTMQHQALDPTIFTGTSVGAYLAAVLLSTDAHDPQTRVAHLERIWLHDVAESSERGGNGAYYLRGDLRRYLDPRQLVHHPTAPLQWAAHDMGFFATDLLHRLAAAATSHEPLDRRALEMFELSAFVSTEPFHDLVKKTVSIENIQNCGRLIQIAATNWKTGEVVTFSKDDITLDAVLASAAIPGIFPAITINGCPYVDGGILMNTPMKAAIDLGADVVHVIALDPSIKNVPPSTLPNTLDTIERMLNITNASRIDTDMKLAAAVNRGLALDPNPKHRPVEVHVYRPEADMGGVFGMLNFGMDRMIKLIKLGFEEAVEHDCIVNGCVLTETAAAANSSK